MFKFLRNLLYLLQHTSLYPNGTLEFHHSSGSRLSFLNDGNIELHAKRNLSVLADKYISLGETADEEKFDKINLDKLTETNAVSIRLPKTKRKLM